MIYHKDAANAAPDDVITISGEPLGVRFSGQTFKPNQPGAPNPRAHYSSKRKITRLEIYPDVGFGKISFDFPGNGKGRVEVKEILRRRPAKKRAKK